MRLFFKITRAAAVIGACLLLAGCGAASSSAPAAPGEAGGSSAVSSRPVPGSAGEREDGPAGRYVSALADAAAGYEPALVLRDDGSFVMTLNLYEAMGELKGSWELAGGELRMQVDERDFEGYLGDGEDAFVFEWKEDGTLVYRGGSLGMTSEGDVFARG